MSDTNAAERCPKHPTESVDPDEGCDVCHLEAIQEASYCARIARPGPERAYRSRIVRRWRTEDAPPEEHDDEYLRADLAARQAAAARRDALEEAARAIFEATARRGVPPLVGGMAHRTFTRGMERAADIVRALAASALPPNLPDAEGGPKDGDGG